MHRMTRAADRLEVDGARRLGGRGAYLHSTASCLASFAGRRGPVRSLRWTPSRTERMRVVAALEDVAAGGR